jgi:sulfofructosephosphate aldolase
MSEKTQEMIECDQILAFTPYMRGPETMTATHRLTPPLDSLTLPSGGFAMVAVDQRDSLRAMFEAGGGSGADHELSGFKAAVAELLAPHASAVLVDHAWGMEAAGIVGRQENCGLILAADVLNYDPSGAVLTTELDGAVFDAGRSLRPEFEELSPVALKLLLLWDADEAEQADALARDFMNHCRAAGKIGLLEVKAPAPGGDPERHATALVEAARRLAATQPDVYKTEVPFLGSGPENAIIKTCELISQELTCPWVVLSSGVPVDRFPEAVALSCRGGASGFLAGRAVWSEAVRPDDYRDRLRTTARTRLERLVEIVDG